MSKTTQNTDLMASKPVDLIRNFPAQVPEKARPEKAIYSRIWENTEIEFHKTPKGPMVVGSHIAEILGYSDPQNAVENHCHDRVKIKIHDGTQNRWVYVIGESDLLRLILRSNKPDARKFEAWVMNEILPSVMNTGRYNSRKLNPSPEGQAIIDAANAKKSALTSQMDFFPTKVKVEFPEQVASRLGIERKRLLESGIELPTEVDLISYIVTKYFEEVT